MVEFKTDNGKRGVERICRTATGYRLFVYNPIHTQSHSSAHFLEEEAIEMQLGRGVEDSGTPFIEIEFLKMNNEQFRSAVLDLFRKNFKEKNLEIRIAESSHGDENLSFHVSHNCLSDVFNILLNINLGTEHGLIPDVGKNFVLEQQQVRHGLEQSLLNAFGQDMYARAKPNNHKHDTKHIPKSEINRIARLVDYFRNGIPKINNTGGATA